MIKAAIDLGTVTSRLMIGEAVHGQVKVKKQSILITDIGEGLTEHGSISDVAYARLLGALLQFKEIIADCKTELYCEGRAVDEIPVKAVATSAMRDAANAKEILSELSELGFEIEIISGMRESELSFKGTLSGFTSLPENLLSIDVGGGSTEVILGTAEAEIIAAHSFDIGSRRITELFLQSDPPAKEELEAARSWVAEETAGFIASFSVVPEEVLAVAGTATSAVTIRDSITEYEGKLVHGKRVTTLELRKIIDELSALPLEERRQVPGLEPGRAPVIVGGLIILLELLNAMGKDSFLVSDTDILQGIILDESAIC